MSEADLIAALRAGDPPARDPAFTLRLLEAMAVRDSRRRAAQRLLVTGACAVAAFALTPLAANALATGDPVAQLLGWSLGGLLGARLLAGIVRPRTVNRA